MEQHLSFKTKCLLFAVFCLFYLPGYFFFFQEIGKENYSLPSVLIGAFFTFFGLFGHSVLLFEKKWARLERNTFFRALFKYFLKILGTVITLPLGIFWVYLFFTEKPDHYKASDLKLIQGTVSQKPEFKKGSKSSTSLDIYLKEYPEYCFEPPYDKFVHFNTNFEEETNVGDTIILGLLKNDYEKSIVKTKPERYIDRHVNYGLIEVYYIGSRSAAYYNPRVHNLMDKEDKEYGWVVLIAAIPFLVFWITIWHTELVRFLRRNNLHKCADLLIRLRARKIM